MTHYFKNDPNLKHNRKQIVFRFLGVEYPLMSDVGVFSKDHVDPGTHIMLTHMSQAIHGNTFLDLGCGYGVVACVIKKMHPAVAVVASDVNERAIELARFNAEQNGVKIKTIVSDGFETIKQSFDTIGFNPPIKVGKQKMYDLLTQAFNHLTPQGTLWVVIRKSQGAPSAHRFLSQLCDEVNVVDKYKGYWVLSCKKN